MAQGSRLIEVYRLMNNLNRFFTKNYLFGYFCSLLGRHTKAFIITSNCGFFYEMCTFLKGSYVVDIIHGLYGINHKRWLSATPRINTRVLISQDGIRKIHNLYDQAGIHPRYYERCTLIHNAVPIPGQLPERAYPNRLKVIFIGRNSKEKRYQLYEQIAETSVKQEMGYEFYSIGNFASSDFVSSHGEIFNRKSLYQILSECHILILCSSSEGLPLVIMEAMACGVIPIATNVGGVSEAFEDGVSGSLVASESEEQIVQDMISVLKQWDRDTTMLSSMSKCAYEYVKEHFSYDTFSTRYLNVFQERPHQTD